MTFKKLTSEKRRLAKDNLRKKKAMNRLKKISQYEAGETNNPGFNLKKDKGIQAQLNAEKMRAQEILDTKFKEKKMIDIASSSGTIKKLAKLGTFDSPEKIKARREARRAELKDRKERLNIAAENRKIKSPVKKADIVNQVKDKKQVKSKKWRIDVGDDPYYQRANLGFRDAAYERAMRIIPKSIDKVNTKIEKAIEKHMDNPEEMKVVVMAIMDQFSTSYKYTGGGYISNYKLDKMEEENILGHKAGLVSNQKKKTAEEYYEAMKIDMDLEEVGTLSDLKRIQHELASFRSPSSLILRTTESGAPITQDDDIAYRDKTQDAMEKAHSHQDKMANNPIKGDKEFIKTKYDYSLESADDADSVITLMESIDKKNKEGYWEWRDEIMRENYLKAVDETIGQDIGSEAADEIRAEVEKMSLLDFAKFAAVYRTGEVIYVYESGRSSYDTILSDLRRANEQAGNV